MKKKSIFSLDDDVELTHLGQSLEATHDDYVPSDDENEGTSITHHVESNTN
jgi:hypothetical protein